MTGLIPHLLLFLSGGPGTSAWPPDQDTAPRDSLPRALQIEREREKVHIEELVKDWQSVALGTNQPGVLASI